MLVIVSAFYKTVYADNTLSFGRSHDCDVFPVQLEHEQGIATPAGKFTLQLSLPGDHNLQNAQTDNLVRIF